MIGIVILGWASCLPEKIWAGEVHYSRIPVEYWEHRIQMIKALGMNALSVYVMWNYHEAKPGLFDFTTENRNLRGFLTLAQKHNMSVLLRPGPYVCAEWDFGGLPAWLLKEKQIEVRSLDLTFMSRSKLYIEKMAEQIRPFLAPNGPIVLLQIENEYGSWGNDHNYIASILNLWKAQIGDFEYYHADGDSGVPAGHVAGLSIGINGCANIGCFKNKTAMYPDAKLVFGGEIYPGWLTHWGESSFQHQDKAYTVQLFSFFVNNNVSFSMYMVHGGTNFGFTNGVNSPVNVHVTSYDYNAPINEHGLNTSKYNDLRAMFMKAAPWPVPDVPQPIPIKALPVIRPKLVSSYNSIGSFFPANFTKSGNAYTGPWSLEENDLPHGMVSYRFNATPGNNQMELYYADYMYVIISGVRTIYQTTKTSRYVNISFTCSTVCPVEITV
jgi:beta-galactosidase